MAAEVIYEEASPVGLNTSLTINGCSTSGLIYADGLPIVIGRGSNGTVMLPVRRSEWCYRGDDYEDRFQVAATEHAQPETESIDDEEYSNIPSFFTDVDSVGMASDSSYNSSHIDTAEEYPSERRKKKKINGKGGNGETWNERLLRQLLKRQSEHRASVSSPSSSITDDDGGGQRRKSKMKVSDGRSPGMMNGRNSIGDMVSGSLSRLFGKLSSSVIGREGAVLRRQGGDRRSACNSAIDGDTGDIGDIATDDDRYLATDDDDFFWSDTEFDTDDIYANVEEFHSPNVEFDEIVAPPGGVQFNDQSECRHSQNVDTISNNVTMMTSSNTDNGDERAERVDDNRETSSGRDVVVGGGKLMLRIKQLRSLIENKSFDINGVTKTTSTASDTRRRTAEPDRRPEEESLSAYNVDNADDAVNPALRSVDVKAVIAQLIADHNAGVMGPSGRRTSMVCVPTVGDDDEKECVERSVDDIDRVDRGAAQRKLLASHIVGFNERRRSVPVGIVFGSRPLTAAPDNEEFDEKGEMSKHCGQVDTKLTRKPPVMEKKFKMMPQAKSSPSVPTLIGVRRLVPVPPSDEIDGPPPLPARDHKHALTERDRDDELSTNTTIESRKHFDHRPPVTPTRHAGGVSNSRRASQGRVENDYIEPLEMHCKRNGYYDDGDDTEYETPDDFPPTDRSTSQLLPPVSGITSPNVGRTAPHPAPRSGRSQSVDCTVTSDPGNTNERPLVMPKPVPVGGKAIVVGVRSSAIGRVIDQLRPVTRETENNISNARTQQLASVDQADDQRESSGLRYIVSPLTKPGQSFSKTYGTVGIRQKEELTNNHHREDEDNLRQYVWYFGDLQRSECESKLLSLGTDGAFIVRRSRHGGPTSPYALTLLHCQVVYNLLIRRKPNNKYALGSEKVDEHVFNSIIELVSFHHNNPIQLVNKQFVPTYKVKLGTSPKK